MYWTSLLSLSLRPSAAGSAPLFLSLSRVCVCVCVCVCDHTAHTQRTDFSLLSPIRVCECTCVCVGRAYTTPVNTVNSSTCGGQGPRSFQPFECFPSWYLVHTFLPHSYANASLSSYTTFDIGESGRTATTPLSVMSWRSAWTKCSQVIINP